MNSKFAELISDLQPFGDTLPTIIHLYPTPAFVDYIKSLNPALVIDMGAGVGRMSKVLGSAGVKCLPIDTCYRDETEVPVLLIDAITFDYPKNSLPIMARPCHGLWTGMAIEKALETVDTVLYVGLEKNIEDDIGGIEGVNLTIKGIVAGDDDERIVVISKDHGPSK